MSCLRVTRRNMDLQAALALVKPFNDFPKKGILFQDIHPIMYNAAARKAVQDHLAERYKGTSLPYLEYYSFM